MDNGQIYIADLNPFNLEAPPLWWQQGLAAFDPDLRILPSRQHPRHWLARVRKYSRGLTGKAIIDDQNDTAMFVKHGLVNVTWIASTEGWSEGFLQYIVKELIDRDTWAVEGGPLTDDLLTKAMFEGGSKYGKALDERDAQAEAKINAEVHDKVYHSTGDGWRSLQARTGERVLNAGIPGATKLTMEDRTAVMAMGQDSAVPHENTEEPTVSFSPQLKRDPDGGWSVYQAKPDGTPFDFSDEGGNA